MNNGDSCKKPMEVQKKNDDDDDDDDVVLLSTRDGTENRKIFKRD